MYNNDGVIEREVKRLRQELRVYRCGGMTKIRLGRRGDGGYVVLREPLYSCEILYSYGIGNDMSFELDFLLANSNTRALLYDPTIAALPKTHSRAKFFREAFSPRTLERRSMMKVDVEGAEWDVFSAWPISELVKLDQLVIEFHFIHVAPAPGLSPYFTDFYQKQMDKINAWLFCRYRNVLVRLSRVFRLVHLHVNNSLPPIEIGGGRMYPLIECSFVNRDLLVEAALSDEVFPIDGLDYPNKTDRSDAAGIKPPEKLC